MSNDNADEKPHVVKKLLRRHTAGANSSIGRKLLKSANVLRKFKVVRSKPGALKE